MRSLIASISTSLLVCAAAPAMAQNIGAVSAVVNQARIHHAGATHPAALHNPVALGDGAETAAASRMQIMLLDRSVFTIGANARLTIDRFVYDPSRKSSIYAASVVKGAFRFISGGAGHHSGSKISTPIATIGIRGTILDGAVGPAALAIARGERAIAADVQSDPESATLVVLRGPGSHSQGQVTPGAIALTAAGQTVELTEPLQAAYVPRAGATPIGPFTLSLPGLAQLTDLILLRTDPVLNPSAKAYPTRTGQPRQRPGNEQGQSTDPFGGAASGQNSGAFIPRISAPEASQQPGVTSQRKP